MADTQGKSHLSHWVFSFVSRTLDISNPFINPNPRHRHTYFRFCSLDATEYNIFFQLLQLSPVPGCSYLSNEV